MDLHVLELAAPSDTADSQARVRALVCLAVVYLCGAALPTDRPVHVVWNIAVLDGRPQMKLGDCADTNAGPTTSAVLRWLQIVTDGVLNDSAPVVPVVGRQHDNHFPSGLDFSASRDTYTCMSGVCALCEVIRHSSKD